MDDTITIVFEDGTTAEMFIEGQFELDDNLYIVLTHDEDIFIYRGEYNPDGDIEIFAIEDDEELIRAAEELDRILEVL